MNKPEVRIKNWSMINSRLHGNVVDHPRFDPDTLVTTSSIVKRPLTLKEGSKVETRNTIYILVGDKA